jgi:hypothetical protein
MSTTLIIFVFLLLYVVLMVQKSVHIAGETERFAVITLGRFNGYRGPGLILILPFVTQAFRLKIGDTGTLISPEFASFAKVEIPVTGLSSINVGTTIEITGFDDDGPRFARAVQVQQT